MIGAPVGWGLGSVAAGLVCINPVASFVLPNRNAALYTTAALVASHDTGECPTTILLPTTN